jgi:hypothetical protein
MLLAEPTRNAWQLSAKAMRCAHIMHHILAFVVVLATFSYLQLLDLPWRLGGHRAAARLFDDMDEDAAGLRLCLRVRPTLA